MKKIGIVLVWLVFLYMAACGFMWVDGVTYGGLFKNDTWQWIRQLWSGWGP